VAGEVGGGHVSDFEQLKEAAVALEGKLAARARERMREQRPVGDGYLTIEEVAAMAHCDHKTVRRAIASGALAAGRPGRRWVIREGVARAWIERPPPTGQRNPASSANPRRPGPRKPRGTGTVAALMAMDPDL
jgi:excisionase family DNA binding protein